MLNPSPSSFAKLLASGNELIATAAEDLATFVDMSPFDAILVVVVAATLAAETTPTAITCKFVHSTASAGTSPVTVKDAAGNDLVQSITETPPAAGKGFSLWIRTRGLNQFGSPQLQATTASVTVCYAIYGIGVRDTSEISAHWTGSFESKGAVVAETAMAP